MTYYWFLLLLILLLCYNSKGRTSVLILCITLFFVFFAFRVGFTPDYENYEDSFKFNHTLNSVDDRYQEEIGFQWLCMALPSYRVLLIVQTLFFCICIYYALKWYVSPRFWWGGFLILFFYEPFVLGNISGMRSCFVTCFFFFSILLKEKLGTKGIVMALFLMFLAFNFHKSAVILIPLLFIPSKPLNNWIKYIVYALALSFIIVSLLFPNELNTIGFALTEMYFSDTFYMDYFKDQLIAEFSLFSILKSVILCILLYITLDCTQKEQVPFKNLFIKYTAFYYLLVLAPPTLGLITRFYYYFAFPLIIGTYYVIKCVPSKAKVYIGCMALYAFWQMYDLYHFDKVMKFYGFYDNILFHIL